MLMRMWSDETSHTLLEAGHMSAATSGSSSAFSHISEMCMLGESSFASDMHPGSREQKCSLQQCLQYSITRNDPEVHAQQDG